MIRKTTIVMAIFLISVMGCTAVPLDRHVEEILYEGGKLQKFSYLDDTYGKKRTSSSFVEAIDTIKQVDPMAMPELEDLPLPGVKKKEARAYTGVIKNKTGYDLAIPSGNSGATLTVPAQGFIEYTAWSKNFELTAYHDGKPFYCLKINANPRAYPFMCNKYDFVAEIVKEEPVKEQKPIRKKRQAKKKAKC